MSRRNRDDSKLSFSELDKRRRERKHGGGGHDRDTRPSSTHAQKSYRAALERAFDSGKLAEFAATMQRGRDPLANAAHASAGPRGANPDAPGNPGPGPGGGSEPNPAQEAAPGTDEPAAGAGAGPGPHAGNPADNPAGDQPGGDPVDEQPVIEPAAPPLLRTSERAERRRLSKKITDATSPRDMGKAVDRYLARFDSLPDDYEALEKILSHPKSNVVIRALEALETCIAKQKPRRSRSLSAQLAILEDTHEDSEVRELAARVRAAL